MLDIAQKKFVGGAKVVFRVADAQDLSFAADSSFDLVVCQFGIMFFPDKERHLSEVFRVLQPGGGYVFNVWDSWAYNPFGRIAHETIGRFFKSDPPQFYRVPFSCSAIDPVKELLLGAGFRDLVIAVAGHMKEVADVDALAEAGVLGNPAIAEIEARATVKPKELVAAFAKEFRAAFGAGPTRMPLQAIIFEARKP